MRTPSLCPRPHGAVRQPNRSLTHPPLPVSCVDFRLSWEALMSGDRPPRWSSPSPRAGLVAGAALGILVLGLLLQQATPAERVGGGGDRPPTRNRGPGA